jgi:DNA polymerase-3 subunit delta'
VWDDLVGQTKATGYLRRAAAAGAVSHAYLFVGPTGVGKSTAARALACAVLCDDGGCGSCHVCRRIRSATHPDLHLFEPEGVAGYVIDQVRDLIRDIGMRPIEARYKVYILRDAGRLQGAAANAFLKTLEEPPGDVLIVLLANDFDDVLATIASRCHVVRFAPVPAGTARALVVERTGASDSEARAALAATDGVIPHAIEFLASPGRRNVRAAIIETLKRLSVMDAHDVLQAARSLLAEVKAPVDEVRAVRAEELEAAREFLTRGAVSEIEKRQKRELTARERDGITEIMSVTESWLRDCLVLAKGAPELVDNADAADATAEVAGALSVPAALRALDAVRAARERIAYNVSPQLAVEAMLFDIQEVLKCPR